MAAIVSVIALLVQAVAPANSLSSSDWLRLPGRPPDAELRCTDHSEMFWSVSLQAAGLQIRQLQSREHVDPVPFRYGPHPDRSGNRHAAAVRDGWLVGFDAGEFGGGLWWFSQDGRKRRRIRPDTSAPVNPQDYFHAENVLGMPEVSGERMVLMGLDHLTGRSGRIFRLMSKRGAWALAPLAVLDAAPDVWFVDGSKLLFVTDSGLWSAEPSGGATRRYTADLGRFAPTSLVRGSDGALYLGLRHYVLRLEEHANKWVETWYAPLKCRNVLLKDYTCECVGQ